MTQELTLEEISNALVEGLRKCQSAGDRALITAKIFQHLDGINGAIEFMSHETPGPQVDLMRERLIACRNALTAGVSAQEAVKSLLAKQQDDLDSFIIRTTLHLGNLESARQNPTEDARLSAALTMVKSFLGSTTLFRSKWKNQVENLKTLHPEVTTDPTGSGLSALEKLPQALIPVEEKIREALAAI